MAVPRPLPASTPPFPTTRPGLSETGFFSRTLEFRKLCFFRPLTCSQLWSQLWLPRCRPRLHHVVVPVRAEQLVLISLDSTWAFSGCPVAATSSLKAIQAVLQASRAGGGRGHICLLREPGRWPVFLPLDHEPEDWALRAPRGIGQWWMEQLARLSCGHRKCLTQLGVCRLFCLRLGHAGHRPSGTWVREGL